MAAACTAVLFCGGSLVNVVVGFLCVMAGGAQRCGYSVNAQPRQCETRGPFPDTPSRCCWLPQPVLECSFCQRLWLERGRGVVASRACTIRWHASIRGWVTRVQVLPRTETSLHCVQFGSRSPPVRGTREGVGGVPGRAAPAACSPSATDLPPHTSPQAPPLLLGKHVHTCTLGPPPCSVRHAQQQPAWRARRGRSHIMNASAAMLRSLNHSDQLSLRAIPGKMMGSSHLSALQMRHTPSCFNPNPSRRAQLQH